MRGLLAVLSAVSFHLVLSGRFWRGRAFLPFSWITYHPMAVYLGQRDLMTSLA